MAPAKSAALSDTLKRPPTLLNLPQDVRAQIYDQLLPRGITIKLRVNSVQTSLQHLYSLARSCHAIKHEVDSYLIERPWIIHSSHGQVLTILHGIPDRILLRISVLVIEDEPREIPTWALLKNLRCICFTDLYESKVYADAEHTSRTAVANSTRGNLMTSDTATTTQHGQPATPTITTMMMTTGPSPTVTLDSELDLLTPTPPPIPLSYPLPPTSTLPPTNTILRDAHNYWKRLRLPHTWIRELSSPDHPTGGNLRIVLRRVSEAQVLFRFESSQAAGSCLPPKHIIGWHSVVDVQTRRILETGWLPERVERRPPVPVPAPAAVGEEGEMTVSGAAGGGTTMGSALTTTSKTNTIHHVDEYIFPYGVMYAWWRGRNS